MQPNTLPFSRFGARTGGTSTTQRKQNRTLSACNGRDRELVLHHAREFLADGAAGELSALIRSRTGLSESRIDRIIASEAMAARAEAATLRSSMLGGLSAATEARRDVIEAFSS